MEEEEKSEREKRVRAITKLYYSNPKVKEAILEFARNREVVPRYFDGFGKRPDMLQYSSDIDGLVRKGATSFHASEEIWEDPLGINSDMTANEMNNLRKSWDLLIDLDSKYLDVSKILALLLLEKLESYGIKNYGIKFSGSKGFHIIVSGKAFPKEFNGQKMSESFPEWPRAICEYLTHLTRRDFNKRVEQVLGSVEQVMERVVGAKKEDLTEALCPQCGRNTKRGQLVTLRCPICNLNIQRKDMKVTKRRLKCVQDDCAGVFEIVDSKDYFVCEYCDNVSSVTMGETGRGKEIFTKDAKRYLEAEKIEEEHSGNYHGASDLVLVAPRHLFRMPYSLHEKTALASVVLTKEEIENFVPQDADPLKVKIKNFLPDNFEDEAKYLLREALEWKKSRKTEDERTEKKKYENYKFDDVKIEGVTEDMFPKPIKKLLKGLDDGKKRGLFILLTFLKSLNFTPEEIHEKIKTWNEKNRPPLREGYVRSQIDWHLKQTKKILPPNYDNQSYYKDLGLLDEKPTVKNPIVEVLRKVRKRNQ